MRRGGEFEVVTGAFGYTGFHIAEELHRRGRRVVTITSRYAQENPFGREVEAHPFHFDDPDMLAEVLTGASALFNTYWIRFAHGRVGFDEAIANSSVLFSAARAAGVKRIVHVSITNPKSDSRLPYFRGKAEVERLLESAGVPYSIVRPTVVFGGRDVFVNNIAWLLRNFPFFLVAGDGRYGIQPVHVDDVARICVEASEVDGNVVLDAAGPEIFAFVDFVKAIAGAVRKRAKILRVPPLLVRGASGILGTLVRDIVLNHEELQGLMAGLVVSTREPLGEVRFSSWVSENAPVLGVRYASELDRHFRRGLKLVEEQS